jgi:3-isopropylmalate/(R)-2-methylmalate dehydratase large subunit
VCAFKEPKTIRVILGGRLRPGVYAKDAILYVISRLGVSGATNCALEFAGPVVDSLGMDGRMTLCNMAVEAGATSGICLCDSVTVDYLWPFIKDEFPSKEAALAAYSVWNSDPDARYEAVHEFDLSGLEPLATVNYKPEDVKPVGDLGSVKIDQVYIGSCTNGRIEDLRVAAEVVKACLARGEKIAPGVRCVVSPATPSVFRAALEEGIIPLFMDAGFCVTNPTCGACLGMSNGVLAPGETCASTTNRNFNGRMGKGGMVHLMSPATAAASAFTGRITNSPLYQG